MILDGLIWTLTACYPFVVWLSLDYLAPRHLALTLAALFLLRSLRHKPQGIWKFAAPACVAFLLAVGTLNDTTLLLAYPVFVSLLFFAAFAYSLVHPPTVIERLARLEDPDLPPKGVAYTRTVTQVWSVFFLANALVSLLIILYGERWLWSLYNGFISYVLMAALMLAEMAVRRKVKASY